MSDPTSEFFDGLARRGHEPALEKTNGTIRFDVADRGKTEHWNVTIAKGDLEVSRGNGQADCVITAEKQAFEGLIAGELNPFTAVLRGTISIEGDPKIATHFRQLFTEVRS